MLITTRMNFRNYTNPVGFNSDFQTHIRVSKNIHELFFETIYNHVPMNSLDKLLKFLSQDLGEKIFSDFLQSLIYFIHHYYPPNYPTMRHGERYDFEEYKIKCVGHIIKYKNFFHTSSEDKIVVLRVDPEQEVTVLMTLARTGDTQNLKLCLIKLATAFGFINENDSVKNFEELLPFLGQSASDKARKAFKLYFEYKDVTGFNIFSTSGRNGHSSTLALLLKVAEKLYDGKTTQSFQKIITDKNNHRLSPLDQTVLSQDIKSIECMSKALFDAYGNDHASLIKLFIPNGPDQSTLLTACTHADMPEIVELLLNGLLEKCFNGEKDHPEFIKFITLETKNKYGSTLFDSACRFSNYKIASLLLSFVEAAYSGKKTDGFKNFLAMRSNDGYSYLQTVCAKDAKEAKNAVAAIAKAAAKDKTLNILITATQEAYENDLQGFINFMKFYEVIDGKQRLFSQSLFNNVILFKNKKILLSICDYYLKELSKRENDDYKKCKKDFEAMLNSKDRKGCTLLNSICKNASYENPNKIYHSDNLVDQGLIITLLQCGAGKDIQNNYGYSAWNNAPETFKKIMDPNYVSPIPNTNFFSKSMHKITRTVERKSYASIAAQKPVSNLQPEPVPQQQQAVKTYAAITRPH